MIFMLVMGLFSISAVCADSCSDVNKQFERVGFEFHPDFDRLCSVTGRLGLH